MEAENSQDLQSESTSSGPREEPVVLVKSETKQVQDPLRADVLI